MVSTYCVASDTETPDLFPLLFCKIEACSLQNWGNANELTTDLEPDKSCYNVFKPTDKKLPDSYKVGLKIHDNVLQYQEHNNYLGIVLNDKLSKKQQITELNKNNRQVGFSTGFCPELLELLS